MKLLSFILLPLCLASATGATSYSAFHVDTRTEHVDNFPMPYDRTFSELTWKAKSQAFHYKLTDDGCRFQAEFDVRERCWSEKRLAANDKPDSLFSLELFENVLGPSCLSKTEQTSLKRKIEQSSKYFAIAYRHFRAEVLQKVSRSPVRCMREHPLQYHDTTCDQYSGKDQ